MAACFVTEETWECRFDLIKMSRFTALRIIFKAVVIEEVVAAATAAAAATAVVVAVAAIIVAQQCFNVATSDQCLGYIITTGGQ